MLCVLGSWEAGMGRIRAILMPIFTGGASKECLFVQSSISNKAGRLPRLISRCANRSSLIDSCCAFQLSLISGSIRVVSVSECSHSDRCLLSFSPSLSIFFVLFSFSSFTHHILSFFLCLSSMICFFLCFYLSRCRSGFSVLVVSPPPPCV